MTVVTGLPGLGVPLRKRMGTGWDVAYAALFLASDEANFITGIGLLVDGGKSLPGDDVPSMHPCVGDGLRRHRVDHVLEQARGWVERRMSEIHGHEMAWAGEELWIVNTLFSCLCTLRPEYSFVPRWKPPFISALAAEDRCHLNGLAVADGRPRYVTAQPLSGTSVMPGDLGPALE